MKWRLAFVTLWLFSLAFSLRSQQPLVGLIQGTVKNQQKAPIAYATLTATNLDSDDPEDSRLMTGTDRRGVYQFVAVSPGRYSIVVQMKGYSDYTVPLVTVYPGGTVNVPEIKMFLVGKKPSAATEPK